MSAKAPKAPIGRFIEEQTERLGGANSTIYSVTNNRGFVPSLEVFDKQVFSADTSGYKRVGHGDIAFNPSRINVGSVALLDDEYGGAVSPMYTVVRCKDGLRPAYLLNYLRSEVGLVEIKRRCEGAVRFMLKYNDLCRIEIPIPSLAEQDRLVGLLDEADALRKLRAQAEARTAQLIPAIFQEMFGEGTFEQRPIGNVATIVTGNTPSRKQPEYYGEHVEWIKTDNIKAENGLVTPSAEHLSALGATKGRVVPAGSVIVTCIAGSRDRIGDAAILDRAAAINQQINAVVPGEQIRTDYAWAAIVLNKASIQARATKDMTSMISKTEFSKVAIAVPPLKLQDEFAARVQSVRALQGVQLQARQKVEALWGSLLGEVFG